jgi:hypothetical protein
MITALVLLVLLAIVVGVALVSGVALLALGLVAAVVRLVFRILFLPLTLVRVFRHDRWRERHWRREWRRAQWRRNAW